MKFKCGKTDEERAAARKAQYDEGYRLATTWTRKFAWFPTTVRAGRCVWLEYYERQLQSVLIGWNEYSSPERIAYALSHRLATNPQWRLREITK